MGTRATYQRTLLTACSIAGDETELSALLGIPIEQVIDWLVGDQPIPPDVFLKAVDMVLAAGRKQIADNRALLEKINRRRISRRPRSQ
jgi:hypothetical protein